MPGRRGEMHVDLREEVVAGDDALRVLQGRIAFGLGICVRWHNDSAGIPSSRSHGTARSLLHPSTNFTRCAC